MSFFSNLAARVHAAPDAVRPRLPLFFDTTQALQPRRATLDAVEGTEDVPEPPSVRPAARSYRSSQIAPLSPSHSTIEASAPTLPAATPRQRTAQPTFRTENEALQLYRPSRGRAEGRDVQDDERETVVPVPLEEPPGTTASAAPARRAEPRVASDTLGAAEALRPGARLERTGAPFDRSPHPNSVKPERHSVIQDVQRVPTANSHQPPVAPQVQRMITLEVPPAIVPRTAPQKAEAQPERVDRSGEVTVHVSIGRIDVRATPVPIERRRETPAPAVMGLGEYLHSQGQRAHR